MSPREPERRRWSLPAPLAICIAVGLVIAIPVMAREARQALQADQLLDEETMCVSSPQEPCLEVVTGQLTGPHSSRRTPGATWTLMVDGKAYDSFELERSLNGDLALVRDEATALTVDGDVVAVVVPTIGEGGVAPIWEVGLRGVVMWWLLAQVALGGVVGLVSYGWRKRKAYGSWWYEPVDGPAVSPRSRAAMLLLAPAAAGWFMVMLEIPWWWSWVAVYLAASVVTLVWSQSSGRRFWLRGRCS